MYFTMYCHRRSQHFVCGCALYSSRKIWRPFLVVTLFCMVICATANSCFFVFLSLSRGLHSPNLAPFSPHSNKKMPRKIFFVTLVTPVCVVESVLKAYFVTVTDTVHRSDERVSNKLYCRKKENNNDNYNYTSPTLYVVKLLLRRKCVFVFCIRRSTSDSLRSVVSVAARRLPGRNWVSSAPTMPKFATRFLHMFRCD